MKNDYMLSFTTGLPGITRTVPEDGAKNIILNQNEMPVLIFFNTKLKPETITSRNIKVRPDRGISVATTWTTDAETGWTNVRVSTQWQPDTNYTIVIDNAVRAFNGQTLGNTPYTFHFHTARLEVLPVPQVEVY
jgi:hypothetical protein